MNTNKELERIVSDWLDDRAAAPPHGSLGSALARAEQTPQQHRWLGRWFRRRSGATRSAEGPDTSPDSNDRRDRLMFSATTVAASAAALALVASLAVPRGAGEPVPGAGGPTHNVAADGSGDYQTISEALAVAEEGDTVLVAPGTYREYLLIDKDITLAGDGPREEIVVEFPADGPAQLFEYDDPGDEDEEFAFPVVLQSSDAILRGLTIKVPLEGGGVLVYGGAPQFVDLSVLPDPDAEIVVGYRASNIMRPFLFEEGSAPVIRDSAWTGFLYGGGSSPTFEDNTITASVMALDGPGEVVMRGNTFLDGALIHLDFDLTGIIEGNELNSGAIGIGAGSSMTVQGNVLSGPSLVSGGPVVTFTNPAIGVGEPGSSARVSGNTITGFETAISVGDRAAATVEGNDLADNELGIHWATSGSGSVEGNTVLGGETGIFIDYGAPSVTGNTVEGASSRGISFGAGAKPTVEGNTVCDCETNLYASERADPALGENEICPDGVAMAE